jgi:hypothetical protein
MVAQQFEQAINIEEWEDMETEDDSDLSAEW